MAPKNSHQNARQPRTDQFPVEVDSGLERPNAWAGRRLHRQWMWLLIVCAVIAIAVIVIAGVMVDAGFVPLMIGVVVVFAIAIAVAIALTSRDRGRARREDALADHQQETRGDAAGSEGIN